MESYIDIEFKMTEITQALGEMWKKLTEEEKAVIDIFTE